MASLHGHCAASKVLRKLQANSRREGVEWRATSVESFERLTAASEAPIRAGCFYGSLSKDPVPPRYVFDYNDVTNVEICSTSEGKRFFVRHGGRELNRLLLDSVANVFEDAHRTGPFMSRSGKMMVVLHLRTHDDVLVTAPKLVDEARAVDSIGVELHCVDCDDASVPKSRVSQELARREHRPFKVVAYLQSRLPPSCKPLTCIPKTKSSLGSLAREIALTTIDDLKAVLVDVSYEYSMHKYGLDLHETATLPGSYAKGRFRLPLVMPYVLDSCLWTTFCKSHTPLVRDRGYPWCLRSAGLSCDLAKKVASLVPGAPGRGQDALRRRCASKSWTPAEDWDLATLKDPSSEYYSFCMDDVGYMSQAGRWPRSTRLSRVMTWHDFFGDEGEIADEEESEDEEELAPVKRAVVEAWRRESVPAAMLSLARDLRMQRRWRVLHSVHSLRTGRWRSLLSGPDDVPLHGAVNFLSGLSSSETLGRIFSFL